MVQDVMSRRQGAGGGSGDTGEIVRSGSWAAHGRRRNDLTIAEGEIREPLALPTRGSASTGILPTIGRTQDIPRVTPHDQTTEFSAIPEAKKPFAARNPIPVGAGRTPEQLALFHASGEPLNPSLSTRQQSTLVMPTVKKSGPKRVATKLAARPSLPKEPGSQGTLFHPSRYKIAP